MPFERGTGVDQRRRREQPASDRRHDAHGRPGTDIRDGDGAPGLARRGDGDELGGRGCQHQGNRKMHEQWMKLADERHMRLVHSDQGDGGYIPWGGAEVVGE